MFEKWQDVTRTIAKRDEDILTIGERTEKVMEQVDELREELEERKRQLNDQFKLNKEEEAKNVLGNRDISERKNNNKHL